MSEKKRNLYFSTLRQEQNEVCDYKFELPVFGESNTDVSYYEPQSSRIANMRKSASGLSTGVYDFDSSFNLNPDENEKWLEVLNNVTAPIGRKPGITFEEISQVATDNADRIKSQSINAENEEAIKKAAKAAATEQAVEAAKAISNSNKSE